MKQYKPTLYPVDEQFVVVWEYNNLIWSGVFEFDGVLVHEINTDGNREDGYQPSDAGFYNEPHKVFVVGDK